eukprot:TRINITY_DN17046_c0_g1_i1.p2 TRINITY_DN17046_c0_g1~~TRINITY_DN17046_c0_g1_i1.p2  ORF type:complete len:389 (-),score=114.97 TRINITY_DN17046_c0_g1_i1:198-1364(-)
MLGMHGMPPWPPAMMSSMPQAPMASPLLSVRVEGLKFDYQLTDDDVRKVFARYGEVTYVSVDREGTSAQVMLEMPHQAMAAQQDLDRKQLAGMSGAFLRVELTAPVHGQQPAAPYHPQAALAAQQYAAAAAAAAFGGNPNMGLHGAPTMPPMGPTPGMPPMGGYPHGMMAPPQGPPMHGQPPSPAGTLDGRSKKNTCKIEVGIENESEFRVGSRVIQIARQIWQDADFQRHGGKTRLRGKGIGGPHEADEPLALCISCSEQMAFEKAVQFAQQQLQKVHSDYVVYCQQNNMPIPELSVKVSRKAKTSNDGFRQGEEINRGDRPDGAPNEDEIERLIEERNEARKTQNFKRADEIRDSLKETGVVLMDEKAAKGNFKGSEVTKWRYWRP